jgi:hypothetical protein
MRREYVLFAITFLSLVGFYIISLTKFGDTFRWYFLGPLLFVIPTVFVRSMVVPVARIVTPLAYAMFAVALFSYGFDNIASSDFYTLNNFGIESNEKFVFEAEDNFFNAITVLFSIMAAFLLWKGLNDFDKLKETLNEEAETIWAIVFLTTYLREEQASSENEMNIAATDKICAILQDYLHKATGVSRQQDKMSSLEILRKSDRLVDECVEQTKKIVVKAGDENDRIALEEIMKNLSSLVSVRSKRRVCMNNGMPPYILAVILIMSMSLLLPFMGNGSETLSVNHLYVFLLTFIHMFIFMTLLDLSSPFDGHFSIQMDAFTDAAERIDELIANRSLLK